MKTVLISKQIELSLYVQQEVEIPKDKELQIGKKQKPLQLDHIICKKKKDLLTNNQQIIKGSGRSTCGWKQQAFRDCSRN
jgi:hypothetical protein